MLYCRVIVAEDCPDNDVALALAWLSVPKLLKSRQRKNDPYI